MKPLRICVNNGRLLHYHSNLPTRSISSTTVSFNAFQAGFAIAAGIGCGAAILFGNRMFAVDEVVDESTPCLDPHCPCNDATIHPCTTQHRFVDGCHELKIVSGNSNKALAQHVAKCLGTEIADCYVGSIKGEISVQMNESVRGKDVYIVGRVERAILQIQSLCTPVSDNILELVFLISTMKRASAKRVTSVIPFFSYRRNLQEVSGLPSGTSFGFSSAAEIAKMLEVVGVDQVILVDMDNRSNAFKVEGSAFPNHIPVETLDPSRSILRYLRRKIDPTRKVIVLALHPKDVYRAANVKKLLQHAFPGIDVRAVEGEYVTQIVKGEEKLENVSHPETIKGCDVIIVDYAVSSGKTMTRWANYMKDKGANRVIGLASHGLLIGNAPDMIQISALEELVFFDTVFIPQSKLDRCNKLNVISVAPIIAEAIREGHYVDREPFLFNEWNCFFSTNKHKTP